jgi:hypothetical protein
MDSNSHVDVGRLSEETLALEQETEVPCSPALGALLLVDHNRVQESHAAHLRNPPTGGSYTLESLETVAHDLAEAVGAVREVLVLDDLEGGSRDGASEGVLHTPGQ